MILYLSVSMILIIHSCGFLCYFMTSFIGSLYSLDLSVLTSSLDAFPYTELFIYYFKGLGLIHEVL